MQVKVERKKDIQTDKQVMVDRQTDRQTSGGRTIAWGDRQVMEDRQTCRKR